MVRLLLLGVCLMCSRVHAQNYLPPSELAIEAISQQAEVLAADERVRAAQAQANALALGSYEFEATLIPQRRRTSAGQTYDEFEVQVGRPFRLPGKAPLDREIGARSRTISTLARNEVAHDAAHRLLDLWMTWLRATATDEEARVQLQSLRTEHATLVRRVELGDASQLDLDLISAELAQARATALQSEALVNAAKHALNTDFPQISLPPRAPSLPDPEPLPGTSEEWQERIVHDSYQLESVEQDAARQEAMAARARADRIPDPNVGVRFFNERDGQERAVGLVFTMPLSSSHRRELANAERAEARSLRREVEVVKRTLARDAHWKVALSVDSLAQWRAQSEAHTAMRAAAGRTHRAWELGETGLAERLLAARREREIAYTELAARADAHEAQLRVRIDSHDLWHATAHEGDE